MLFSILEFVIRFLVYFDKCKQNEVLDWIVNDILMILDPVRLIFYLRQIF